MHSFNGYDIELTRGDSLQFKVNITGRELPTGTVALFTVKKSPRDDVPVMVKEIAADEGGVFFIGLSNDDTDIDPRVYYWDLRVLIPLGDGRFEVRTPMPYSTFTILEVIGDV